MWILNFIPDSILHLAIMFIIAAGLVLYVLGMLVKFIPTLSPYKIPIKIISIILLVAGVYLFGGYGVEMEWRHKAEEAQAKIDAAEKKSEDANIALDAERKKKQKVITEYAITVKDRIVEVEKKIDADCKVDKEAIQILNDASVYPVTKGATK